MACGGTFETGAGFDPNVTVAGLHELLRECLGVAPGLAEAHYGETRVGLRPTSSTTARRRCAPGLEERMGGHAATGRMACSSAPTRARLLAERITGAADDAGEPWAGPDPTRSPDHDDEDPPWG